MLLKGTIAVHNEEGPTVVDRPLLAYCHAHTIHKIRRINPNLTPEALGYRIVRVELEWPRALYARPWVLWAVLRGWENTKIAYWKVIRWLYRHGVFHLTSSEGDGVPLA